MREQGKEVEKLLRVHIIKGYFVVHVRKSVKHVQILTLFKTENIGIPSQTNKKQKERKQAPVIHKFQVYEYL